MNPVIAQDLQAIVAQTPAAMWRQLRNARLFITGGTGFIGKWLLASLLQADTRYDLKARVTLLTRDPHHFQRTAPTLASHPAVSLLQGDARQFNPPDANYTHLICGAATAAPTLRDCAASSASAASAVQHLFELAIRSRTQRILYISSGAVYAPAPSLRSTLAETSPLQPITPYGQLKLQEEQLCGELAAQHHQTLIIVRPFTFIGPWLQLNAGYAATDFIRQALSGQPLQVNGHPQTRRSWLYAADMARWIWTVYLQSESGDTINIGSTTPSTIGQLALSIRSIFAPDTSVVFAEQDSQPHSYLPDCQLAQTQFDLQESLSLNEALHRTRTFLTDIASFIG